MNWYREYQAEWKEIIETVARELGRREQMVEKRYHSVNVFV